MSNEVIRKGFRLLAKTVSLLSAIYFAINVLYSPIVYLRTNRSITGHGEWSDLVYFIGFFAFTYCAYWLGKNAGKEEMRKQWKKSN